MPSIFQAVTADHQRMFNLLKDSGLNWIAVFPPHFTGMCKLVIVAITVVLVNIDLYNDCFRCYFFKIPCEA